jgi:hypothetical protein
MMENENTQLEIEKDILEIANTIKSCIFAFTLIIK